jgi:hypothetical protein
VRPNLEKSFTKKADGVAQGVGPEFKPPYYKTKESWKGSQLPWLSLVIPTTQETEIIQADHGLRTAYTKRSRNPFSTNSWVWCFSL